MIRNPRAYEAAIQRKQNPPSPPPEHYEWQYATLKTGHQLAPLHPGTSVFVSPRPDGRFNILHSSTLRGWIVDSATFAASVRLVVDRRGHGFSAGDMNHVWALCDPSGGLHG